MTTAVKVIYVDAQNLGVLPPNCKEDGLYQDDLDKEQSKAPSSCVMFAKLN